MHGNLLDCAWRDNPKRRDSLHELGFLAPTASLTAGAFEQGVQAFFGFEKLAGDFAREKKSGQD
jgi:hypothetical protein